MEKGETRFAAYKAKYGLRLDREQEIACQAVDGHILLLAVPGSGKTSVMIARLGYMVRALGVDPKTILATTYSVAGAKEMQRRYEALFGHCDVEIRTINGFCAAVIHRYERVMGRTAFRLLDKEAEVTAILRGILSENGSFPNENELRDVRTAITYCRNSMLTDDEIEKQIRLDGRDFLAVYRRYRAFKQEHKLMDYDDQLCYGYRILCTCPEVNAVYADRFRYICVDEAQDTSKIQHMILRKVAERYGNLFMVGDEDQSIYGFRAAYPEGLLTFDTVYPDARILSIGRNYRSSATIVEAAGRFIAGNTARRAEDKTMVTDNPKGVPIRKTELPDLRHLPAHILTIAKQNEKEPYGSVAVLTRLNDSLLPLVDCLSKAGVPYRVRGGDGLFFSHHTVVDTVAVLRFAANPFDAELFRRLYYRLLPGMKRGDMETVIRDNVGSQMLSYPEYVAETMSFPEKLRNRAERLAKSLFRIQASDSCTAIGLILKLTAFGRHMSERGSDTVKLNVLRSIALQYPKQEAFLKRLPALEEAVRHGAESERGICLSTIHSAKGMEFDHVILCDAENGVLPSIVTPLNGGRFTEEEKREREEERRLFYVGVTRAKRLLECVTWTTAFGEESDGFAFVAALLNEKSVSPKKKTEKQKKYEKKTVDRMMEGYYDGVPVTHKVFGDGVVVGRRGDLVQIRFQRYSVPKTLDLRLCLETDLLREP